MNTFTFLVGLSQPWEQEAEVGTSRTDGIKNHKVVESNTENHSRQKVPLSLESQQNSGPQLETVCMDLRSNRSLRWKVQLFERNRGRENIHCFLILQETNSQVTTRFLLHWKKQQENMDYIKAWLPSSHARLWISHQITSGTCKWIWDDMRKSLLGSFCIRKALANV